MSQKDNFMAQYGDADHITHLLNTSKDSEAKETALYHNPITNNDHIKKAMSDGNWYVREAAARHKDIDHENLMSAIKDNNSYVREAAIDSKNVKTSHLKIAVTDDNSNIRRKAIKHPDATSEVIHTALGDEQSANRYTAIQHPNASKENFEKASKDIAPHVAGYAKNKLKELNV